MDLVTLQVFGSDFEASLAKNLLGKHGVRAHLAGGVAHLIAEGAPVGCVLQVAEEDLTRAAEILSAVWDKKSRRAARRIAREAKLPDPPALRVLQAVGQWLVRFLVAAAILFLLAVLVLSQ